MSTGLDRFWEIMGWVLALEGDAFVMIASRPHGLWFSLFVVFLAGLSLAIEQSLILFINRVKPLRFVVSLLLNAVLFAIAFLFLALSTWLICLLPWSVHVPLLPLITVLGLGYIPLLFSFLGALPYFGRPILNLLSVWNLLAMVVGFGAIAKIGLTPAVGYIAFGWVIKQILENTIGQPIAHLGGRLADRVAGVKLADSQRELQALIQARIKPAQPRRGQWGRIFPRLRQMVRAPGRINAAGQAIAPPVRAPLDLTATSRVLDQSKKTPLGQPLMWLKQQLREGSRLLRKSFSLMVMAIAFVMILIVLHPIRDWWFGWYSGFPVPLRLAFDLAWISFVAIVFAGLLAPLETLGWWAGWYGETINTAMDATTRAIDSSDQSLVTPPISRYLVYLDGIGQSGNHYTPDVEAFLAALKPALPKDVDLVRGLMMYSVLNKPLDEDRPLAFLWKLADRARWGNPAALLGFIVNLRNIIIVAVSSDNRYGPIYNQGIAQIIIDELLRRGYQPGSGVPITLLGYSGGGEMSVAVGPYLKRASAAPIDVIALGGVMSANNNVLKLEHLYHIVGEKDSVERLGPIMFPGRWELFALSYWNRAKRRGKITLISAGPVGHQVPGGYMDPEAVLPDGRTHLHHTVEMILTILRGKVPPDRTLPRKLSRYAKYLRAIDLILP